MAPTLPSNSCPKPGPEAPDRIQAALSEIIVEAEVPIEIRQSTYLSNIIEQDHRFLKQRARAALGFKTFRSARATIQGIELVHMIRKGQVRPLASDSPAEQFNALAA